MMPPVNFQSIARFCWAGLSHISCSIILLSETEASRQIGNISRDNFTARQLDLEDWLTTNPGNEKQTSVLSLQVEMMGRNK